MLSVLLGEHPDLFKQIVEFYVPQPKVSLYLDLTYGDGKLWSKIEQNWGSRLLQKLLRTNDPDPESPADLHLPVDVLAEAFAKGHFKVFVYDPPYLYGRHSVYLITSKQKDSDWKPVKTEWTVEKQIETAELVNEAVLPILASDGLGIVKIMDTRSKGEVVRNHDIIIDAFTNFKLVDQLVYVRTNTGFFQLKKHAQNAHGYYLIFQNRKDF